MKHDGHHFAWELKEKEYYMTFQYLAIGILKNTEQKINFLKIK